MIHFVATIDPTAPSIVLESDYVHVDPPPSTPDVGIDLRYSSTSTLGLMVGIP